MSKLLGTEEVEMAFRRGIAVVSEEQRSMSRGAHGTRWGYVGGAVDADIETSGQGCDRKLCSTRLSRDRH